MAGQQKFQPSLDKGTLPLRHIRDAARRALIDQLDSVRGRKGLVLESEFASPLSLVAEALTLKEHGVEVFSVLDSQPSVVEAFAERGVRQVVYLVHSRVESLQAAVRHMQMCQGARRGQFEFTLLVMPRRSALCERLLEEGGLLGDVAVRELPLDWVPLDEDLLSLEVPWAFKELVVDRDRSCLYYVARALQQLQQQTGTIPHIKGKGDAAAAVQRILSRLRREQGRDVPAVAAPGEGIDTLILLDRSVDLVTPMCTQLTYEGLLDEVFSLNCGQLRMTDGSAAAAAASAQGAAAADGAGSSSGAAAAGKKVYGLNSADAVFRETRDQFYGGARRWLNETLRTIQQFRDSGMHTADISQLRGFVAELREKFVRIPLHTSLIEQLATAFQQPAFLARQRIEAGLLDEADEMPAIEDLMFQGEPLLPLLRLLCLYCAVHGGVPRKHYESLRKDLLNSYGHQHVLTLSALGKAGLLQRREGRRSPFPAAKHAVKLLLQEGQTLDEANPSDIHFTFAGYGPLSARLVQQALSPGGWAAPEVAPVLAQLPGQQFELLQTIDDAGLPVERKDSSSSSSSSTGTSTGAASKGGGSTASEQQQQQGAGRRRRTVLVVFIGGVTHAEVAALRFLSSRGLVHADFVVATTGMCTGSSLLRPLLAASSTGVSLGEPTVAEA